MKFILSALVALLVTADAKEKEKPLIGTKFRDPIDMPDRCPKEYGMLLKTYIPDTKQAALTVPCELDDKECLG